MVVWVALSVCAGPHMHLTPLTGPLHAHCTLQWRPSQLIADLQKPTLHARGWRPKPQIVELLSTDPVCVSCGVSCCMRRIA